MVPFHAFIAAAIQLSKQSARPSARMVAAPSRTCRAFRCTAFEGLEADRVLGDGRIAASLAACVGVRSAGLTPK
jgi:hypothetical protein